MFAGVLLVGLADRGVHFGLDLGRDGGVVALPALATFADGARQAVDQVVLLEQRQRLRGLLGADLEERADEQLPSGGGGDGLTEVGAAGQLVEVVVGGDLRQCGAVVERLGVELPQRLDQLGVEVREVLTPLDADGDDAGQSGGTGAAGGDGELTHSASLPVLSDGLPARRIDELTNYTISLK